MNKELPGPKQNTDKKISNIKTELSPRQNFDQKLRENYCSGVIRLNEDGTTTYLRGYMFDIEPETEDEIADITKASSDIKKFAQEIDNDAREAQYQLAAAPIVINSGQGENGKKTPQLWLLIEDIQKSSIKSEQKEVREPVFIDNHHSVTEIVDWTKPAGPIDGLEILINRSEYTAQIRG